MRKSLKKRTQPTLPHFKSEGEEREFWATHEGTDYFDVSKGQLTSADAFHGGVTPVTIRFSTQQVDLIRRLAKKMDVGYQSLIKVWLDERLLQEKTQRHF